MKKPIDLETPVGMALAGMFGRLEKLEWFENEDCLLGTVTILGTYHHVTFVRVHHPGGVQTGTHDPENRLDDVLCGADCAGYTVKLPGFEGEWVVGVDPYRR